MFGILQCANLDRFYLPADELWVYSTENKLWYVCFSFQSDNVSEYYQPANEVWVYSTENKIW